MWALMSHMVFDPKRKVTSVKKFFVMLALAAFLMAGILSCSRTPTTKKAETPAKDAPAKDAPK